MGTERLFAMFSRVLTSMFRGMVCLSLSMLEV